MVYYLLICRSLTYAQRMAHTLERAGITARIQRTPRSIAGEGCSHAVRIGERSLTDALTLLKRTGQSPKQVFILGEDRTYQAVWPV